MRLYNSLEAIQRAACVGITVGAIFDCDSPLKASVNERLLVGNLADILTVTFDVTNTSIITDITMQLGKAMFEFQGARSSNIPDISGAFDDVSVGFIHQLDFSVFEVDAPQKENLQAMASVKQFLIYQNPNDTSLGDAVFEVMGVASGLEMSTIARLPASKDGSYKIQLRTPEAASETSLPNSFFDGTSFATTLILIDALLVPAV